jgi:cobalt-zinc-cadmium efflux system outer membrane protein
MRISVIATTAVMICLRVAAPSAAQPALSAQSALTIEEVIERVRARAPQVLAALARVDEARGVLLGASMRFRQNPVLDVDGGPRAGANGQQTWDLSAAVAQTFETGGQRGARIASAESDIRRERATADETTRVVIREVALAAIRALAGQERLGVLTSAEQVATDLRVASERRYQVGDIAALDLNLARIAAARAAAERSLAEAELADALRPLRIALGLSGDAPLAMTGSLSRQPASRDALLAAAARAPALRVADAEIEQADADLRLGAAMRRPDIGARLTVKREQDDRVIAGGLTVTLPAFDHGQSVQATAGARMRRLAIERDAAHRAIEVDIDAGLEAYQQRAQALAALRDLAMPAAQDNEDLAARSFDAGEINLLNLLLVRRDVNATRLAYIDALTEAALAAVEIDARAGVLR